MVQMVGVHSLAMQFLATAATEGQTTESLELTTNSRMLYRKAGSLSREACGRLTEYNQIPLRTAFIS